MTTIADNEELYRLVVSMHTAGVVMGGGRGGELALAVLNILYMLDLV
jgi:DhnA family fructose-bisphosphate aldolase class Ia